MKLVNATVTYTCVCILVWKLRVASPHPELVSFNSESVYQKSLCYMI